MIAAYVKHKYKCLFIFFFWNTKNMHKTCINYSSQYTRPFKIIAGVINFLQSCRAVYLCMNFKFRHKENKTFLTDDCFRKMLDWPSCITYRLRDLVALAGVFSRHPLKHLFITSGCDILLSFLSHNNRARGVFRHYHAHVRTYIYILFHF